MISGALYHLVATSIGKSARRQNHTQPTCNCGVTYIPSSTQPDQSLHCLQPGILLQDQSRKSTKSSKRNIRVASRQVRTEYTHLELAICVHQKVTRLQIPMQNVGRVDVLVTQQMSAAIYGFCPSRQLTLRPQRVWYKNDWKCASDRGCPERICTEVDFPKLAQPIAVQT